MTDARDQVKRRLRNALEHVRFEHVRDGSWFRKVLEHHARTHQIHVCSKEHWNATYPGLDAEARAQKHVDAIARRAAAAGAFASAGASIGELLSIFTEGLALPIGLPTAMLSMAAEGAFTTLLQLELATDLASMYGVPFGEDVEEMSILFALALGLEDKKPAAKRGTDEPPTLLSRLMDLEDSELATHIGKKLLEDAVLRNVVPLAGIGISVRWNYVATKRFGARVRKYVRYRRALTAACDKMRLADIHNPEVFVRGAWLLATCDGEPTREEMMAVARVLDQFPNAEHQLPAFNVDDEEAWFTRVANIPDELDERLIDLLILVAAIDQDLGVAEKRFLARLGKTLHRHIKFERIEALCAHLRDGDDLADDFFVGVTAPSIRPPPERLAQA
jgi:hypothetical protein